MTEETSLISAQRLDVAVIFSDGGIDEILKEIESRVDAHVPDVSTDKGRKEIASLAHKVARSKTVIDNFGKDVIADWKKKTDNINGYRKHARDFLDALKDRVRQPLTAWEYEQAKIEAEKKRKEEEKIKARVCELAAVGVTMGFFDVATMPDDEYAALLEKSTAAFAAEQARIAEEKRIEAERLEKERIEREAATKKLEAEIGRAHD